MSRQKTIFDDPILFKIWKTFPNERKQRVCSIYAQLMAHHAKSVSDKRQKCEDTAEEQHARINTVEE